MQTFQKLMWITLISSLLLIGTVAADEVVVEETETISIEGKTPSGTVVVDQHQVSLLLGAGWGTGTLLFDGNSYAFKTKAAKLGGVGMSSFHLHGDVYNLNDLKDFAGHYIAAQAGASAGYGKGVASLKNSKGVVLRLKAKEASGLSLNLGIQDVKITME